MGDEAARVISEKVPAKLAGRCANSFELDHGCIIHAIPKQVDSSYPYYGSAICGAKPGRRSAGFYFAPTAPITCPKCLRRINQ